jgi:hypothetical protein
MPAARKESEGPSDDVRRKFREALERKQGRHADGTGGADGKDRSKAQSPHGPAKSQRTFRRKSGG